MSKKKRKKDVSTQEIETFDYMKTIKTNLLNVLKDEHITYYTRPCNQNK
jgi:hypothetical protein